MLVSVGRAKKTPKIENFGLKFFSLGPPGDLHMRSHGTKFENKIFNFKWFLALPTKTSFTTPHYYPKYGVWAIEISFL